MVQNMFSNIYIIKKLLCLFVCQKMFVQMRATKTAAYYISPIEIGVLWAKITYIKIHSKALGFGPQTDMK